MSAPENTEQSRPPWVFAVAAGVLVAVVLIGAWFVFSDDDVTDPGTAGTPTATPSTTPSDSAASPAPGDDETSAALPSLGEPRDLATDLAVPWGVAFLPDGSALVSERTTANVVRVASGEQPSTVGTVPGVTSDGEGGLLGIALSPDYAQDRLVYAYFTTQRDNRIVSMKLTSNGFGEPTVILAGIPRASYHDGGRLMFGPDGMLYATTGDHGEPDLAQDPRSLAGKILRMTPSGGVPQGNPWPNSLVWSYGHRNVQGIAFDDDGRLWATEFGNSDVDELNLIEAGANYGWPLYEGDGGKKATKDGFANPQLTWPVADASPSGLAWLDGVLYMGALRGEQIWQIPLNDDRAGTPRGWLEGELGRIRTVAVSPDGELWVTTSNTDGRGEPRSGDDRVVSVSVD